jgi:cytochrome c oxidase subunit IV
MEIFIVLFILSTTTYLVIDGQINIPTEGCCGCFLIILVMIALPGIAMLVQVIQAISSLAQ